MEKVEKLLIILLLAMSPGVIKPLPLLWGFFGRDVICSIIDVCKNSTVGANSNPRVQDV